jgi:hypothetical protein
MFRLTVSEWQSMRSQNVTAPESSVILQSQNMTASQNKRNTSITPFAFTEQGALILQSCILFFL